MLYRYLEGSAEHRRDYIARVPLDARQADPARPVAAGHGNFPLTAG